MVDKTFRTYTDREHRAMAGLSWGGCQTLIMSGSPGAAASRSLFLTSLNGKQIIVRCEHCKTSHLLLDNHLFTILDHNALVVLTYLLTSEVEALAILGTFRFSTLEIPVAVVVTLCEKHQIGLIANIITKMIHHQTYLKRKSGKVK